MAAERTPQICLLCIRSSEEMHFYVIHSLAAVTLVRTTRTTGILQVVDYRVLQTHPWLGQAPPRSCPVCTRALTDVTAALCQALAQWKSGGSNRWVQEPFGKCLFHTFLLLFANTAGDVVF